jgi:dTMP kinase
MERGKLILIEGGEGCGKGEQSKRLLECFKEKNISALILREPGGTKEAELIREILLNKKNNLDSETELFLYEAARREIFQKKIIPELNNGKNIILDRSWPSTCAYQGYAGGISLDLIKNLNYIATLGINPDLLIIININYHKGLSKEKEPDRFALKGEEYHKKVNEGYLNIAKKYSNFSVIIPYQEGKPELMQKEIQKEINKRLNIPL